jgi:hypothetical protein
MTLQQGEHCERCLRHPKKLRHRDGQRCDSCLAGDGTLQKCDACKLVRYCVCRFFFLITTTNVQWGTMNSRLMMDRLGSVRKLTGRSTSATARLTSLSSEKGRRWGRTLQRDRQRSRSGAGNTHRISGVRHSAPWKSQVTVEEQVMFNIWIIGFG